MARAARTERTGYSSALARLQRRVKPSRLASAALLCLALFAAASAQEPPPGAMPPYASGPAAVPVTVEIFNDYQCPACALMNEEVKEFEKTYRGSVRVVFRNFPLNIHKYALSAAQAVEAAGAQGKFREMIETLYARQKDWSESLNPTRLFAAYARRLGLDPRRFKSDMESARVVERIRLDMDRGRALNLKGTPTLYVNGVELEGLPTRREIHAAIEKALPPGVATVSTAPRFEDYPVRHIFKGPVARVRLDSKRARMFRTRLREDSRTGPNFAGRYTVVFWGCGTGCAQMAVVDAGTGRVYWPPFDETDIPDEQDVKPNGNYRLDSRLLVVTQNHYDGRGGYTASYYLFAGGRFRLLRKAEERWEPSEGPEN